MVIITEKKEGATPFGNLAKLRNPVKSADQRQAFRHPVLRRWTLDAILWYDLIKDYDAIKANLICEADIGVGTFLVTAILDIRVFYTDNHGYHKSAGLITMPYEKIPIPVK